MSRAAGGDLTAAEPARVLRVPGTRNFKYQPERDVAIETFNEQRIPLADLLVAIPLADEPEIADDGPHDHTPIKHGLDVATRFKMARSWLATQAPAVQGQGGDNRTYQIACAVAVGHDLDPNSAFEALKEWNARCQPPWTEPDLRTKIRNAIRYATGRRGERLIKFPNTESGDAECFA